MLATKPITKNAVRRPRQEEKTNVGTVGQSAKRTSESKEKWRWMGAIVLCTGVALFLVQQYSVIASTNLDVERVKQKMGEQQEANAKLQDRVNELSSPSRVMGIARDKLNMVPVPPMNDSQATASTVGSGQ